MCAIPHAELEALLRGYGYAVHTVEGDDPALVHQQLAGTMDAVMDQIRAIQRRARSEGDTSRPAWPVIVLRTPKGWTGPKEVDGHKLENFWRSHQVPIADVATNPAHLSQLEAWLHSYKPEELFDESGAPVSVIKDPAPTGKRRMSSNPHANGGALRKPLRLPDFRNYAVPMDGPGKTETRQMGLC